MSGSSRASLALCCALGLAGGGCGPKKQAVSGPAPVVMAPAPASTLTDIHDLFILRHRAAMGEVAYVRGVIAPRLARATEGSDTGRDALRRLAIELALVQGEAEAASSELLRLSGDVQRLGASALPEERAIVALLEGALLFHRGRFLEARRLDLRALSLLESEARSPMLGDALRALGRDTLALNNPNEALELTLKALSAHRDAATTEPREVVEDLLLMVEILLALRLGDEAMIAAGDCYNAAVEGFGSDSLPHAEALVAVAAATIMRGELGAASSLVGDALTIQGALQAAQGDDKAPVSERLALRLEQLRALVPASDP